ncbi:hypothetical protein ES708_24659 [subsurface metagenome]
MNAAGHQVVARPFRGALGQNRRLYLDKALVVQEIADKLDGTIAQLQVLLHPRPPQVEVAVFQAQVFVHLAVFVDVEGRHFRGIEDFDAFGDNLDCARSQLQVFRPLLPRGDLATDPDDVFAAYSVGFLMGGFRGLRVENHLDNAAFVTQVDEYQAPVVAATVNPPRQRHLGADVLLGQLAAAMSFEQKPLPTQIIADYNL